MDPKLYLYVHSSRQSANNVNKISRKINLFSKQICEIVKRFFEHHILINFTIFRTIPIVDSAIIRSVMNTLTSNKYLERGWSSHSQKKNKTITYQIVCFVESQLEVNNSDSLPWFMCLFKTCWIGIWRFITWTSYLAKTIRYEMHLKGKYGNVDADFVTV